MRAIGLGVAVGLGALSFGARAQSFVNFESPHVHPLELTPDGQRLLAVNTADNRLEVFGVGAGGALSHLGAIPVGLEPVSVRARSSVEAWVVNQVSDSVSIVDLTTFNVVATIFPGDEPADVVFAAGRAFVSVAQLNQVKVYDPLNPGAPAQTVAIAGEDPRALATDGATVFAAVFESGNRTSILTQTAVSTGAFNPYPGEPNPPPNSGSQFDPPIRAGLPVPPAVGLIVRKDSAGVWRDDNNGNWSAAVGWDLHDHDVAMIDATTLSVTYATGLMNANMAIAAGPGALVTVVGTDATNVTRFEPNVQGTFVRVKMARFSSLDPGKPAITDLNPHLTYTEPTAPQSVRDESIGDPRAVVWTASGGAGFVAGMGSNSVIRIGATGARTARTDVGRGPTGLALLESAARLFVLNRFDGTISAMDTATNAVIATTGFYDPTPAVVKSGRPFLYETRRTSGLGQAACASCHIDGRMDQLAWDLGDPQGQVKTLNQPCNFGLGGCENWHPMKGPMTTQTLFGLVGVGPLHWRGDREDLAAFNGAFRDLQGDDVTLTAQEMADFTAFVNTLTFPPNPNRTISNSLTTTFPNGGNPANGQTLFNTVRLDGNTLTCSACHAFAAGTNGQLSSAAAIQETQSMKIPHLRNLYRKTGFSSLSSQNNRGFGFIHDGSVDSLFAFLQSGVFTFAPGAAGTQQRRDVEAFMMSFSIDTHAGVGVQTTLVDGAGAPPAQTALIDTMVSLASGGAPAVGLVVKGLQGSPAAQRGYVWDAPNARFQSDASAENLTLAALKAGAAPGRELTFTLVPFASRTRMGIDRDLDGFLDRDEILAGSNPADPNSVPGPPCPGDTNGDDVVNFADLNNVLSVFGQSGPGLIGDVNHDGVVNFTDLNIVLSAFGTTC